MKRKTSIIERSTYSEFFIEILWKTPLDFDLMEDYIGYLVNTTTYKNRKEAVIGSETGITRKELKQKIESWNKILNIPNKNKGPSYSKKIKNLIDYGLIKHIDYPMSNKQYRYVINKFKVIEEIISLVITDKSILKIYYKDEKTIKLQLTQSNDLREFDAFIWKSFSDAVLKMSRHREDFREINYITAKSRDNLKEKDNPIVTATIKRYIEHFIFYHAMLYFEQIKTGKIIRFPRYRSRENCFYEEFLKCCWLYVEYNVFSSWLMQPYFDITLESLKLKVGKNENK